MLYFNKSRQSCLNHIKHISVHLFFLKKLLLIRPEYTIDDYVEASHHVNKEDTVLPRKIVVRSIMRIGKEKEDFYCIKLSLKMFAVT